MVSLQQCSELDNEQSNKERVTPEFSEDEDENQSIEWKSCFWMENRSGEFKYIPASLGGIYKGGGREECYHLDSCNEGLGQSGGDCYKWASSAESKGVIWDIEFSNESPIKNNIPLQEVYQDRDLFIISNDAIAEAVLIFLIDGISSSMTNIQDYQFLKEKAPCRSLGEKSETKIHQENKLERLGSYKRKSLSAFSEIRKKMVWSKLGDYLNCYDEKQLVEIPWDEMTGLKIESEYNRNTKLKFGRGRGFKSNINERWSNTKGKKIQEWIFQDEEIAGFNLEHTVIGFLNKTIYVGDAKKERSLFNVSLEVDEENPAIVKILRSYAYPHYKKKITIVNGTFQTTTGSEIELEVRLNDIIYTFEKGVPKLQSGHIQIKLMNTNRNNELITTYEVSANTWTRGSLLTSTFEAVLYTGDAFYPSCTERDSGTCEQLAGCKWNTSRVRTRILRVEKAYSDHSGAACLPYFKFSCQSMSTKVNCSQLSYCTWDGRCFLGK